MTVKLCSCGLIHDTLIVCSRARRLHVSGFLPQPNEAKTVVTTAPVHKIKTILGDSSEPVSVRKVKNKPVTRDGKQKTDWASKAVQTVTRDNSASRMAELRKRKAATGLIEVRGIWTHPDYIEAIKACAKKLNE